MEAAALRRVKALLAAKAAGTAIIAPSNFFLFFSSYTEGNHAAMHMN